MLAKAKESEITRSIMKAYYEELMEHVENDVAIIGAGPSGLVAGMELAKHGIKTTIIERNNYLGGGFWIGGYLTNKATVRAPANEILDEAGIKYKEIGEGLFLINSPEACAKLISYACECGVKILNMTSFDDLILKKY